MSEIFTNILTIIGQQKKAQAEASGVALGINTFKVGDGNGVYYEPNENQTALVNVKYTGTFEAGTQSQIVVNTSAPNEVLYKCFIPADIGGFTIRELGLFDDDGDLILICKLPAQDKFALASGVYQPLTFTPKIIYTNPQTQAVLTPASQIVPTISEVSNMIQETIVESVDNISYSEPIKNINGSVLLDFDDSLKVTSGKLGLTNNDSPQIFCINSGNTTNGNSDILSYSGTTLSFKVGTTYDDLLVTYADKSQETLTSLANITGLSTNGSYIVLKEKGDNPVAILSTKVTQGKTFPTSPTDGDYHCLTATDLKSYKRVSGAWVEAQYVPIGTVTVAGSVITVVTTNLYNQNGYDVNIQTQGYRFPGYSNPISKSNSGFTATADGWLAYSIHTVNGNGYVVVYINGQNVGYCGGDGSNLNAGCVPISKGDVVTTYIYTGHTLTLTFYQAK